MFKKAEKNELRTWFLADVIILVISGFASFLLIGDMIQDLEFKVVNFIFGLVFLILFVYCIVYAIKLLKAYRTFDERKAKEKQEKAKLEKEEQEKKQKELEEEKKNFEEIRRIEEEKRKENMAEIEAHKKEALEDEEDN